MIHRSILNICRFGFITALAMVSGCGGEDGPPRYDIAGLVTFDGNTVDSGELMFIPDVSKGNKGPAANAKIVAGQYSTAANSVGKGVVGGPHIVRVIAFDGKEDLENELPFGNPLFPEYEMKIDLPAVGGGDQPEPVDIEVPKEAADPPKKRAVQQV